MKLKCALTIAALFAALPALAQSAPTLSPAQKPQAGASGKSSSSGTENAAPPSSAPVDPAKAAAIRHLMDVTGSSKLGDEIQNFITTQVRQGVSRGITPEDRLQKFMDEFSKEFATRFKPSQIDDSAVAIYAANLSMEDIQGITQFYESPVGQRMIKALPSIVQQSQNAGVEIAQSAALATLRSMSAQYPELNTMLPAQNPSLAPTPGAGAPPANSGNGSKLTPIPQQPH